MAVGRRFNSLFDSYIEIEGFVVHRAVKRKARTPAFVLMDNFPVGLNWCHPELEAYITPQIGFDDTIGFIFRAGETACPDKKAEHQSGNNAMPYLIIGIFLHKK